MLAEDIGQALRAKKKTLAVAESCTGGKLGDMLTEVPGSSDYFLGGVISYSNDSKTNMLGVERETLKTKGAVSEEVALQMAAGARRALGADIGVGITGVAGPGGSTATKPIGLVYIAVSSIEASVCRKSLFKGSRSSIKKQSAERALAMLKGLLDKIH